MFCGKVDYPSTRALRDTVKISALDQSRRSAVSDYTGQRAESVGSLPAPPASREDRRSRLRNSSEVGRDIRDIFFGAREDSVAVLEPQQGPSNRAYLEDTEYSVGWVFDDVSANCMRCDAEFSLLRRRHHCRKCTLKFITINQICMRYSPLCLITRK